MSDTQRQRLLALLDAAVAAAHPSRCLPPHLPPLPEKGRLVVLGAGKAAAAMAVAAEAHYAAANVLDRVTGAVTPPKGYALATSRIAILEGSHPVPDETSVAAAARALDLARGAGPDDLVLVLLSGGASALWAAPVAGLTLADKRAVTRALLKCGAPIAEMNVVRRHLSRIKGGRLARAANGARMLTLAISDVPGDDPATIGSGPTVPDPTTRADARAVIAKRGDTAKALGLDFPPAAVAALADPANETPKPGDPIFARPEYRIIATPAVALDAAARLASAAGYEVQVLGDAITGEARDVADAHARLALEAKRAGRRTAILSGGELEVTVRHRDGRGGRNQAYALALALALSGATGIAALAADTDGIDGGEGLTSDPAGALIDPTTLARAAGRHLNAKEFLERNDSRSFFEPIGDLVMRGPTHTNVNDFRAILVDP